MISRRKKLASGTPPTSGASSKGHLIDTERIFVFRALAFTVRAIASILAGHERHHTHVLRERYLPRLG